MPFVAGVRRVRPRKDAGSARSSATGATEDAAEGAPGARRRLKLDFAKDSF